MKTDPVDRLMHWVQAQPDAPAIVTRKGAMSYADFGRLVRRLAYGIAAAGEHPRVLIQLPQGAKAYAAMFATLWAGGYYSPMNLDAPAARQKLIRDQFGADVAITSAALKSTLEDFTGPIVTIEELAGGELDAPRTPHDLAYVIFTSGSTGVPKGVMIGRNSLAHYLGWAIPALDIGPGDRCSQHPNIGFDLSVLDIYASLCGGAALAPLTDAKDRLMPAEAIRDFALTVWISVPSVIDLMRRAKQVTADNLGSLRMLLFCGEPLLPAHLESLFGAIPRATVLNTYGPTEATVSCTALTLLAGDYRGACASNVAFGDAIAGMRLDLIGGDHADEGEIVLSGVQLARGYWRDAERTAQAFRPLPDKSGIGYFTGDWGERRSGHLFFSNRIDRQVKIHGYRFELGEVDAALRRAGITVSFTIFVDGMVISFIEGDADIKALHAELATQLPPYGQPKEIRVLPALPRNANDKIDGLALARLVEQGDKYA